MDLVFHGLSQLKKVLLSQPYMKYGHRLISYHRLLRFLRILILVYPYRNGITSLISFWGCLKLENKSIKRKQKIQIDIVHIRHKTIKFSNEI